MSDDDRCEAEDVKEVIRGLAAEYRGFAVMLDALAADLKGDLPTRLQVRLGDLVAHGFVAVEFVRDMMATFRTGGDMGVPVARMASGMMACAAAMASDRDGVRWSADMAKKRARREAELKARREGSGDPDGPDYENW